MADVDGHQRMRTWMRPDNLQHEGKDEEKEYVIEEDSKGEDEELGARETEVPEGTAQED